MPSSGGSVSDAPVNKVVDGQNHYLAYITPDEGKSLKDQGGQEVITDSGIPAYPAHHGVSGESAGVQQGVSTGGGGPPGGGDPGMTYDSRPPQLGGSGTIEQAEQFQDTSGQQETTDNIITKVKNTMSLNDVKSMLKSAPGLLKNSKLMSAITTTFGAAIAFAGGLGGKAQSKAIDWDLNRRLQKEFKIEDDPRYRTGKSDIIQDRIRRANLPSDDPEHYGQSEYMDDYPGQDPAPDRDGDNARGLTNIITPYAAHAIGGTTPVNSMAAQWYAGLGSGPSNPGAFNLTQQYAAAKAAVSQRLGTPTSVGQMAVSNSPFFNFLKDNSLNKGIL